MEIGQPSGIKYPLIHNSIKNREDVPVLNDCNKKNTIAQIDKVQRSEHSDNIGTINDVVKNTHTKQTNKNNEEVTSRYDNVKSFPIDPRDVHSNYLKLISGTSLEEDHDGEQVYISKHGQPAESSYDDDGSSEDFDYEDEMTMEE